MNFPKRRREVETVLDAVDLAVREDLALLDRGSLNERLQAGVFRAFAKELVDIADAIDAEEEAQARRAAMKLVEGVDRHLKATA